MPLKLSHVSHVSLSAFLCTYHWYFYVIIINMIMIALCEFYTKASQMTRYTHRNGGDLSSSDNLSAVITMTTRMVTSVPSARQLSVLGVHIPHC